MYLSLGILGAIFCYGLYLHRKTRQQNETLFIQLEKEKKAYQDLFQTWHDDNKDNLEIANKLRADINALKENEAKLRIPLEALQTEWKNFAEKEILKHKTELEKWKAEELQKEIDKSVTKSRTILRGKALEQFAAFSEVMKEYSPTDFRFIGSPFDYVIIHGANKVTDGLADDIEEVIIADIKTGNSQLTKLQRAIKKAVELGKVKWKTLEI